MDAIELGTGFAVGWQRSGFSPGRLFSGGAPGGWYDPSDLSSMAQTSDGTVAAATGAPVGLVRDRSPRGNTLRQADAGARPLLEQNGRGCAYLAFDGIDRFLSAASADFDFTGAFTVALALRFTGGTTYTAVTGKYALGAGWDIGVQKGVPRETVRGESGIDTGYAGPDIAGRDVVVLMEASATAVTRSVDGVRATTSGAWTPRTTATPFALGQRGSDGGSRLAGRIYGAVMIGRALTGDERKALEAWLAVKAGAG